MTTGTYDPAGAGGDGSDMPSEASLSSIMVELACLRYFTLIPDVGACWKKLSQMASYFSENANLFKKHYSTRLLENGAPRTCRRRIWAAHEESRLVHTCDGNISSDRHSPVGMVWLD